MSTILRSLFAVLAIFGMASSAPAVELLYTVDNPTPAAADAFGKALVLSGDHLVVGDPEDRTLGTNAGAAYLFDAATGNLIQTFNNPNPTTNDNFGGSVGMSGNHVVVGARGEDGLSFPLNWEANAGRAYVFDATTGALVHTLFNPAPVQPPTFVTFGAGFGDSVAVSGTKAVIGAPFRGTGGAGDQSGDAYLFDTTTGALLRAFANPTSSDEDKFGGAVAIDGNYVVIGAHDNDSGATNAGAAYLYDATTGNLLQTFANPTPAANDQFGSRVAVSGNRVLVSGDRTGTFGAATAYVFDATTGVLLQTFPHTNTSFSTVGNNVALAGNRVLLGTGTDVGSASLFDATTGALLDAFTDPTPGFQDRFGFAVALSEGLVVAARVPGVAGTPLVRVFEAAVPTLIGDYNVNGTVDAADYVVWRKGFGTIYTQTDYDVWRAHFGQTAGSGAALPAAELLSAAVPEPATFALVVVSLLGLATSARRRSLHPGHGTPGPKLGQ